MAFMLDHALGRNVLGATVRSHDDYANRYMFVMSATKSDKCWTEFISNLQVVVDQVKGKLYVPMLLE